MNEPTTTTTEKTADLLHDPVSHYHWLDFGGFPGTEIHATLKAAGWHWSRYRSQYFTNRRWAKPPEGIAYTDQGECDYSAERADRLTARAEKHEQQAADAHRRSDALVANIPLGQPILVGHHSEKAHRRVLERSRNLMFKMVEESSVAEDLRERAEASARHQRAGTNVGKMCRRRDRLAAEVRKMERDALTTPTGVRSTYYDQMIAANRAEIAQLRAAIEAAGGEPGMQKAGEAPPFKKGDYIKIGGFAGVVLSIGPKNVKVNTNSGGRPWPLTLERNRFQAVLATAEELAARRAAKEAAQ